MKAGVFASMPTKPKLGTNGFGRIAVFVVGLVALALAVVPVLRWNLALAIYMPTCSNLYFTPPALFDWAWNQYLLFEVGVSLPLETTYVNPIEIQAADYTWAKLKEASNTYTSPVVIRGLFKDSRAVREFATDKWLAEHSDFDIQTIIDKKKIYQYEYEFKTMNFSQYVKDIKAGKTRYSYGLDELYVKYPHLIADLEIERFGWERKPIFCRGLSLFITGKGRGLKWHNADNANIGTQFVGSKVWEIIDPKYTVFMGPQGNGDPYSFGYSCRTPQSIIDRVPRVRVTIHPGDAIYAPVFWWHTIPETIEDPERNQLNMFGTCRFSDIIGAVRISPTLELWRHVGFVNWIHPNLPIAVRWIPFFRVLQDSFREFFNLMPDYDSEDCFSSKRDACERYFRSIGYDTNTLAR